MELAICIKCGGHKRKPYHKCRKCGFNPRNTEDDLVKSVYLSTRRYDDPDEGQTYREKLLQYATLIKEEQEVPYDTNDLTRLREQKRQLESVKLSDIFYGIFRLFAPALALLGLLYGLVLLLRWLREGG